MKILAFDVETVDPHIKKAPSGAPYPGSRILCACGAMWDTEDKNSATVAYKFEDPNDIVDVIKQADIIVGANIQYDLDYLTHKLGHVLREDQKIVDVIVTERLIDTVSRRMNLGMLGEKYCQMGKSTDELEQYAEDHGIKKYMEKLDQFPMDMVIKYCYIDCWITLQVFLKQNAQLKDFSPYYTEMDIQRVLYEMRKAGVPFDSEYSTALEKAMQGRIKELEKDLYAEFKQTSFAKDKEKKSFARYCDERQVKYTMTAKTKKPQFNAAFFERNKDDLNIGKIHEHKTLIKLSKDFVAKINSMSLDNVIYANLNPMKSEEGGTVTGRFSCVSAETLVLTGRGHIPIVDIKIGDKVLSHKNRWCEVENIIVQPSKEALYDVYLSNGNVLTCTMSHKLLRSNGQWSSLKDILLKGTKHGILQEAPTGQEALLESCKDVQGESKAKNRRHSKKRKDKLSHGKRNYSKRTSQEALRTAQESQVLYIQDGIKESYEGQGLREAPQLERSNIRPQGVSYNQSRKEKNLRTKTCNGTSARIENPTRLLTCPSHRRRSFKQRFRKPGFVHSKGTPSYTRSSEANFKRVSIKKIDYCRSDWVYDLTVKEDHSYITAGVCSHNCTKPNLQQIPSRNKEWAPLIRAQFYAPEGYSLVKMDYSQQEVRMLLHLASENKDPKADEMIRVYKEDPNTDCYNLIKEILDSAGVELERNVVKQLVLAYQYCMGPNKLSQQLMIEEDEAYNLLKLFGKRLPFINKFKYSVLNEISKRANETGEAYIETIAGRKIYFPVEEIEKDIMINGKAAGKFKKKEAVRAYAGINYKVQGSCADVAKKAMVQIYKKYKRVPILMVHDELDFLIEDDLVEELVPKLKYEMENTFPLRIPMTVDVDIYKNWGGVDVETRNKILSKQNQTASKEAN